MVLLWLVPAGMDVLVGRARAVQMAIGLLLGLLSEESRSTKNIGSLLVFLSQFYLRRSCRLHLDQHDPGDVVYRCMHTVQQKGKPN